MYKINRIHLELCVWMSLKVYWMRNKKIMAFRYVTDDEQYTVGRVYHIIVKCPQNGILLCLDNGCSRDSVRLICFPARKSNIDCSSSSTATFAFYGRHNKTTCPVEAADTTTCSVPGATDKLRAICQDKTTYDVSRSFPDLAPSIIYTCRMHTMVWPAAK